MTPGFLRSMSQDRDTSGMFQPRGFGEVRGVIGGAAGRVGDDEESVGGAEARKVGYVGGVDGGGFRCGEAVVFVEDEGADGRGLLGWSGGGKGGKGQGVKGRDCVVWKEEGGVVEEAEGIEGAGEIHFGSWGKRGRARGWVAIFRYGIYM